MMSPGQSLDHQRGAGRLGLPARQGWDRMLLVAVVVLAACGLALVMAPAPMATLFNRVAFGTTSTPVPDGDARRYVHLVHAVLGAVMFGWSITIGALVRGPLRRREAWAWHAIVVSLSTWFVLDTGYSVATKFWGNTVLNAVVYIMFAIPLGVIHTQLQPTPVASLDAPPPR